MMPVCTIVSAAPLSFDDGAHPRFGRTSFVVTCPNAQTTTIVLVYSHELERAWGGEIRYDLSATPNGAVWGSGADGAALTVSLPAGRPTTFRIYARIAPGEAPPAGAFTGNIDIETTP